MLSDAEKDEISEILYRVDRYLALTVLILFLPAFFLLWSFRYAIFSAPLAAVAIFALCLLTAQYLWASIYWLMLQRPLASARPTSERITVGEQFDAVAGAAPSGFLIFFSVFFAALLVFFVYGALQMNVSALTKLASLVLAVGGVVFFLALLAAKRRARQN